MIHRVKGFSKVNEAEVDIFWNSLSFTMIQWIFTIWSLVLLTFLNPENIWKFSVNVLLKPSLENFENHFAMMWNECNCAVVWTFFGIAFLWDWNENWPFPVLKPLLRVPNCWYIECSTFTASSFRIWNSSAGIPSPPLALFLVILPKAYLTSLSRMSGSRWVTTPSWLSGSWKSFFVQFCVFLLPLLTIFCFC